LTVATNGETLGCTIVHNGKLTENVERARESLGLVHTAVERMKIEAKFLAAKQVRQDDLARFFVRQVEGMKLSKERAEVVLHQIAVVSHDEINNLTGMRGSAWAAYNAFSEWVDHAQRRTGLDARVESIWMGEGARQKSRAWGQLLAM
jgi:hypothetical protein